MSEVGKYIVENIKSCFEFKYQYPDEYIHIDYHLAYMVLETLRGYKIRYEKGDEYFPEKFYFSDYGYFNLEAGIQSFSVTLKSDLLKTMIKDITELIVDYEAK
jgi:hypothetical protein